MKNLKCFYSTKGFTLIELLITVAIAAIIMLLAIPAYKDYTIRSKITECVNQAAVAKLSISEYRQTLGAWPQSLKDAGLDGVGNSHYCVGFSGYQISNGSFTINIDEPEIDVTLTTIEPLMTPHLTMSGMINWLCTRGTTSEANTKYLPALCRGS